jgi:hypothetical protein
MPKLEGTGNQADKPLGRYTNALIQDEFFPMARGCVEDFNARSSRPVRGSLVLAAVVVGDPSVGGVVDSVNITPGSSLQDEELMTCMRESMLAMEFGAPPEGAPQVDFSLPISFSAPDAGG